MTRRRLRAAPSPSETPPAPVRRGRVVGRDRELHLLVDLLAGASATRVVVDGVPGVGRTLLLDAAQALLDAAGLPVRRLPVRRCGTSLPDLRAIPAEGRPVVVLDDGHLLDEAAASMLHDLAALGRVRLLLALPTGARPPEPISALCRDDACARVALTPLGRHACDRLVADLAAGTVDGVTARRIWTLTAGLPRLVVGLVRGLADSGLLVPEGEGDDEVREWVPPGTLPAPFADEVLADRLHGFAPPEREALDLLVCSGPVGPEILVDAGADPDALEHLERVGLVAARSSRRRLVIELPDRLLMTAIRQRIGRLRRRRLAWRLAQAWQARGCRRQDDVARSAGLLLDAGGTPPAKVAERGARQAAARGNYRLAERLARSALQSGARAPAAGTLAEALSSQGRAPEAESTLLDAGAADPGDHSLQLVRAWNLRWGMSDRETSRHLVEEVLGASCPPGVHTLARLTLGSFHLYDGRFLEALALAGQVLAGPQPGLRHRYRALTVSISALASLGRDTDAVDQATEAAGGLGCDPAEPPPALPEIARHQFTGAVTRAHLLHGDLDAAEDVARRLYESTADRGLAATATWASLLGEVALLRGRVDAAIRLLDEARTAARRSGFGGLPGRTVRLMATKNLARAHLESGHLDAARRVLADLAPGDLSDLAAVDLWTGDVEAALAAATGHTSQGVETVLRTAGRLKELQAWGVYVPALHQAVRFGGAGQLPQDALEGVTVQGPLLGAQADQVRAAATGDAEALLSVAQRYARLGAFPFAAEAAASAARLHEAAGRRSAALRAASLAQACAGHCDVPLPSVTALLHEPAQLTPRQREIARLAARGLASRAIAERLVVSVRTVDNYLGQVYRKLGISNRSQLAEAMGLADCAVPPGPVRLMGTRSGRQPAGQVE